MANNNQSNQPPKEIRREVSFGTDKILLIMQFPCEPPDASREGALRKEILDILGETLSQLPPAEMVNAASQQTTMKLTNPASQQTTTEAANAASQQLITEITNLSSQQTNGGT